MKTRMREAREAEVQRKGEERVRQEARLRMMKEELRENSQKRMLERERILESLRTAHFKRKNVMREAEGRRVIRKRPPKASSSSSSCSAQAEEARTADL